MNCGLWTSSEKMQLTYGLGQKMKNKLQLGLPSLLVNLMASSGTHQLGQKADLILCGSCHIQCAVLLQSIHDAFSDEGNKIQAGALYLHQINASSEGYAVVCAAIGSHEQSSKLLLL